ncbi:hypothetical protein OAY06_02330, partial [bacterium]|nr:hypothetical protein [bacterium]
DCQSSQPLPKGRPQEKRPCIVKCTLPRAGQLQPPGAGATRHVSPAAGGRLVFQSQLLTALPPMIRLFKNSPLCFVWRPWVSKVHVNLID